MTTPGERHPEGPQGRVVDPGEVVDAERSTAAAPSEGSPADLLLAAQEIRGPLPSSGEMAGYKAVDPALPGQIVEASGDERAHRHKLENRASKASVWFGAVGHTVGTIFVLGALVLAFYAVQEDAPWVAAGAVLAAVAPIVLAMLARNGDSH